MNLDPSEFVPPDFPELPDEPSTDVVALALKWKGKLRPSVLERLLRQVNGRLKTIVKLPFWNARTVAFPASISLEQCSSEATARYKASLVLGRSMADLTGGFGVDTWALSQQFSEVDYVEQQEELCMHARYNFPRVDASHIRIVCTSAEHYLKELSEPKDLLYLDPARRNQSQKVFQLQDCEPRLDLLWNELNEKAKVILVKLSPLLDLKNLPRTLSGNFDIHVISVENECKEILLRTTDAAGQFHAVLLDEHTRVFSFTAEEEAQQMVSFSEPQKYLYEPDVALLKVGAFKRLVHWFPVEKLAPNSHLYTSSELISDFPGRRFEVLAVLPYTPKQFKKNKTWPKANVTVRNFPTDVATIREQCGIKDGGEVYLFATTLLGEKLVLVECRKV